VCTKDK